MVFDGRVSELTMGDVSGRRAVMRLGWGSIDRGVTFGLRVLLWRWRWLMAWQMLVYRDAYMPSDRIHDRKEVAATVWGGFSLGIEG